MRDDVGVFLRDVEAFAGTALEVVQLACRGWRCRAPAPLRRDETQLPPVHAQRFGNRTLEVEEFVPRCRGSSKATTYLMPARQLEITLIGASSVSSTMLTRKRWPSARGT